MDPLAPARPEPKVLAFALVAGLAWLASALGDPSRLRGRTGAGLLLAAAAAYAVPGRAVVELLDGEPEDGAAETTLGTPVAEFYGEHDPQRLPRAGTRFTRRNGLKQVPGRAKT